MVLAVTHLCGTEVRGSELGFAINLALFGISLDNLEDTDAQVIKCLEEGL